MDCPSCRFPLVPSEALAPGLTTQSCTSCEGSWIAADEYRSWLERQCPAQDSSVGPGPLVAVSDDQPARICPVCKRIMLRHQVGHGADVVIDVCGNCAGVWLDAGEWESLRRHGLDRDLNRVTSDSWQSAVHREEAASHLERVRRRLIGEDYDEVIRIRDWLNSHPHRDEIIAVWVGPHESAR